MPSPALRSPDRCTSAAPSQLSARRAPRSLALRKRRGRAVRAADPTESLKFTKTLSSSPETAELTSTFRRPRRSPSLRSNSNPARVAVPNTKPLPATSFAHIGERNDWDGEKRHSGYPWSLSWTLHGGAPPEAVLSSAAPARPQSGEEHAEIPLSAQRRRSDRGVPAEIGSRTGLPISIPRASTAAGSRRIAGRSSDSSSSAAW